MGNDENARAGADACTCHPENRTGGTHARDCVDWEPECTCYESEFGHQPGCPMRPRPYPPAPSSADPIELMSEEERLAVGDALLKIAANMFTSGYAAGRTRGIDEERKRREGEIKPLIGKLHTLCLDFDARELDDVKHAIWKAVTGEAQ